MCVQVLRSIKMNEEEKSCSPDDNTKLLAIEDVPDSNVTTIQVGGENVKLDNLGPIIVNTDGSLSRIPNWANLSDIERDRSLRLIAARNKRRTEALKQNENLKP